MMASVSSLDNDLRKLRLDKYTPGAAKEARGWIEAMLGERLPPGDLLESLKDGVQLCKLANLATGPPGVKSKQSTMPFVQMENISHFLRACQSPPLNLPDHDIFLTVDLYEQKDPAQVLQCIGAFSRAANSVNPTAFPVSIGPRKGVMSPQTTGSIASPSAGRLRGGGRGTSNAGKRSSIYGKHSTPMSCQSGGSDKGRWSPTKSPTQDRATTLPAWNYAQYGYLGGASQGNLGISFGGRRQITGPGPSVPNTAEKQRPRKEQEAEAARQRQRQQTEEEEERHRKAELEAEEERARLQEEHRWADETRRVREQERKRLEDEKDGWEEEERRWKMTEEKRRREEDEAEARLRHERGQTRSRGNSDGRPHAPAHAPAHASPHCHPSDPRQGGREGQEERIKQLERHLELARQREAEYERERGGRARRPAADDGDGSRAESKTRARSGSRPARPPSRQESWSVRDEQDFTPTPMASPARSARDENRAPALLPCGHEQATGSKPDKTPGPRPGPRPRPLPDPAAYAASSLLASPPARQQSPPRQRSPGAFVRGDRGLAARASAAVPGPPHKPIRSLLEREMEMERQRQREWEESQQETARAARPGNGVDGIGGGIGGGIDGRWDVSQWSGFTGGDNQNKGAQGIGAGRRQMVGPRPLPGRP